MRTWLWFPPRGCGRRDGLPRAEDGLTTLWAPPTGYQIAYRLARSSPHTFTTVEVGATVRQFTATELAPESAYTFRLSAKTRQGWGEPLEATVITTEKRGETWGPAHSHGGEGEWGGQPLEPWRRVASRSGLRGRRVEGAAGTESSSSTC